ncbi:MAG: threonine--tRNA ligase [Parcubacteria group bacterium]
MEELDDRDHRKIGKELDLFTFSDVVGKGLPLYTEKGAAIRRELEKFVVEEEIKRGYKHVITPDIAKLDLYKKSGHYPYYKDTMYAPIVIDEEQFMLRPMTCPHHFELYLSRPRSYRDLPMRIAELAKLYRYENSGNLIGLIRVRSFCLADAHIICADDSQAKDEIAGALDLIQHMAGVFGLKKGEDFWYRLSLGDRKDDKKYFKDDNAWDKAEEVLRDILKNQDVKYYEAADEAAFYGPKIDIQMKDRREQENTAFTVQYDFVMPKRFNLVYTDKENKERETVVVHRSSIGAIERIMAFLIEHYEGAFPVWLSPVQAVVIPVSDKQVDYAESVFSSLVEEGIRAEVSHENETLNKRIRSAELMKIPYILVVGEKEATSKTVSVRKRSVGDAGVKSLEDFLKEIQKEIKSRKDS